MENTKIHMNKIHSVDKTIPMWYQKATIRSDQSTAIIW